MLKYRVYPTLLDEFQRYREGKITLDQVLNRINRIRDFDAAQWALMQRGTRFEKAVLGGPAAEFEPRAVETVRSLLPRQYQSQYLVKCILEQSQVYGYADVVGERRVIDIKTTRKYVRQKYIHSYQNLYLHALAERGCTQMEYLVYDFEKVHHLIIDKAELDLDRYREGVHCFEDFLEEHRARITDARIFIKTDSATPNLFE
jgi:hypothetical protein